ncbi:MAG: SRPBCC family protein [Micromonosporaceae bacterium]
MAEVEVTAPAPPEKVYAVLADGWTYSDWVVGTAHIRDVDPDWPAPGSRIHHKAGMWPLHLRDETVAVEHVPGSKLVLRPHLWPLGEATVTITLSPAGDDRTRITIHEDFDQGPLRWARTKVNDLVLHYRNVESLHRLADLAAGRSNPGQ